MTLVINTNLNELNKYRGMLLKSEFMEKYVKYNIIFFLKQLIIFTKF